MLLSTHISSFIEIGQKMTKLSSDKSIFSTKINQAWPMVTYAYRPFNGLNFGLISTHISSFINIGQKMTKLSSVEAIFWQKSVRRDPWSPMHIGLLMNSTLGWYQFQLQYISIFIKIGRKMTKLSSEKAIFRPKSLKHEGWVSRSSISRSEGTRDIPNTYPHSKFHIKIG